MRQKSVDQQLWLCITVRYSRSSQNEILLFVPAANSKDWLQFIYWNQALICKYPSRILHKYCHILDFSLSVLSASFTFYICVCSWVLSANLSGRHVPWNLIYRANVYCIPKRNDRPLAKDLFESRLLTLETVSEWKFAGQSTIHHCCILHRQILHHQGWF